MMRWIEIKLLAMLQLPTCNLKGSVGFWFCVRHVNLWNERRWKIVVEEIFWTLKKHGWHMSAIEAALFSFGVWLQAGWNSDYSTSMICSVLAKWDIHADHPGHGLRDSFESSAQRAAFLWHEFASGRRLHHQGRLVWCDWKRRLRCSSPKNAGAWSTLPWMPMRSAISGYWLAR